MTSVVNAFAKIQIFFITALISVGLFSCDPNEKLPPETILEYVGCLQLADSTGIRGLNLQVHFQDGDGNIGIVSDDEADNLHVKVFDKQTDTTYKLMQSPTLEPKDIILTYRIPVLSTDQKSSVKGMLDIVIQGDASFDIMQSISKQGIVRFEIFMYDQNLIQSNIITTPDIYIR